MHGDAEPCTEELQKDDADTSIRCISRIYGDTPDLDWGRLCVWFVWESLGENVRQFFLSRGEPE